MFDAGVIFGPNNHSKWEIKYRDVLPERFSQISGLILSNYPHIVKEVVSMCQFDGAEINSNNFKVVFTGINGRRNKMLIRLHRAFNEEFVSSIHSVASILLKNGCKVCEVILDKDDNYIVHCDGEIYSAYQFVNGNHFRGTEEEIVSIGQELGKFDKVLANLQADSKLIILRKTSLESNNMFEFSLDIWKDIISFARSRKQSGIVDWFDEVVIDYGDYFMKCAEKLSIIPFCQVQLVHSDLHPHNLITDGVSLRAIIDLDSINCWERIRAISFGIHRLIRQYVVYTLKAIPDREEIGRLRDLFLENYCKLSPLSSEEILSVRFFIEHEALKRATYTAKDFYFRNNPAWKDGITKHILSLREAEYFDV